MASQSSSISGPAGGWGELGRCWTHQRVTRREYPGSSYENDIDALEKIRAWLHGDPRYLVRKPADGAGGWAR